MALTEAPRRVGAGQYKFKGQIISAPSKEAALKAAGGPLTRSPRRSRQPAPQGQNGFDFSSPEQAAKTGQTITREQADMASQYNRPNEVGAFGGSQEWSKDPNTGQWTKKTLLSDNAQQQMGLEDQFSTGARKAGVAASNEAFGRYQQPYNYNGVSQVMGGQELGAARNKAASSAYEAQMGLLRPEFEQQQKQFEAQAANKGWVPGSKVYEQEKTRLANQQAAQQRSIADQAYGQGLNEYNTMFNTSTQDRSRQIAEMNQMRDRPMQEASTLMGAGPGVRQDQFTDYGPIQMESVDPSKFYQIGMQGNLQNDQQAWQGRQNALDRNNQMAMTRLGKGGGLSPQQEMQMARDQMMWEQQNGFRANYNKRTSASPGAQIAGSIGAGVGQGVGAGLGQAAADWWS